MTKNNTQIAVQQELNINLPANVKPEYNTMLANIKDKMPSVAQATSNFHKSHSQKAKNFC